LCDGRIELSAFCDVTCAVVVLSVLVARVECEEDPAVFLGELRNT